MSKRAAIRSCLFIVCIGLLWACSPRVPVVPPITLEVETTPDEATPIATAPVEDEAPTTTPDEATPVATAPVEDETATATPEAAETVAPTPEPRADWPRYTNETYGFTFRYPITWTIELLVNRPETQNRAHAVLLTRDNLQLLVEYRHPDEDVWIGPDALPEGEVTERETVMLLGRAVPKYMLEQGERDLVVFVGEQIMDLELYLQMQVVEDGDAEMHIPEAVHAEFDAILHTFIRMGEAAADPYLSWMTYERTQSQASPAFAFRYPPDWALDETGMTEEGVPALDLRWETWILRIQAQNADGDPALGPPDAIAEIASEAGVASFLGTSAPRRVVVEDDQLKTVFIHHRDAVMEAYITLTGDTEQIAYSEIDLPESVRHVMDQILASFLLDTN